ncbi:Plasmid stabilization system protein [Planctomycetes bacterium MalM25]|nr:Plasmid stabilization system protein [Planctomycetes bacterium MalM25]
MKTYRVRITAPAEADVRANYRWWAENRSADQAAVWLFGVRQAMLSLNTMPDRYGYADERELMRVDIRQMSYGVGSRPTHRLIYEIVDKSVVIYRVRSARQDRLTLEDVDRE